MGIEDEVQSPRIYYKKDGVTYDIAFYSKMTADDAVGYLRYGVQTDWATDAIEEYYLPYVAVGHAKASEVRVMVGGTEYALLRQGYIVGTHQTLWDINPAFAWNKATTLNDDYANEDSAESYNLKVTITGKTAKVAVHTPGKGPEYVAVRFIWLWEDEETASMTFRVNGPVTFAYLPDTRVGGYLSNIKVEVWQ